MSVPADGWLVEPLAELDRRFAAALSAGAAPAEAEQRAAAELTELVSRPDIWRRLPLLNALPAHGWRPGRLARFRGMIQDMHDPEFYVRTFGARREGGPPRPGCGRLRDALDCAAGEQLDPALSVPGDRQTLRCVTVPCRTGWVREAERAAAVPEPEPEPEPEPTAGSSPAAAKRPREEEEDAMEEGEAPPQGTPAGGAEPEKRFREAGRESAPAAAGRAAPHDLPLPGPDGMVCLVKVYDDAHGLSLNQLVEFAGVVSLDPELESTAGPEEAAHHPPPSLAPRLHALAWRPLAHSNPLLEAGGPAAPLPADEVALTRRQLLSALETALLGDALAAEYLLCHLLSAVYVRKDMLALGKFALNVTGVSGGEDGLAGRLYRLLESVTEKARLVPLSLHHMNSATLVPKKDYDRNVLVTGDLQLSDNTHLVIDETALTQGQLGERGVMNVAALGHLITWQKVEYDFSFHRLPYAADCPVLVLSEGKSLLPNDCRLPLQPTLPAERLADQHAALEQYLTPALLHQIRRYLTQCRSLEYSVPAALQSAVQQQFVNWRQEAGREVKPDDLHHLLVLARLLSLSRGQTELTEQTWSDACRLEDQRRDRLQRAAGQSATAA